MASCIISLTWCDEMLAWQRIPSEWGLSFWSTLQAAADAEKYGHATERYAQDVVTMTTFAARLGGACCSAAVALGSKLMSRALLTGRLDNPMLRSPGGDPAFQPRTPCQGKVEMSYSEQSRNVRF